MPFSLNERKTLFLVAGRSDISLDEYTGFYGNMADYYADLPLEDQVFGPLGSFFRELRPEEFDFCKECRRWYCHTRTGA